MKMNKMVKLCVVITSLFLLVSCGSDTEEIVNNNIQDTYLEGKITGDVNGEAFSFFR